MFVPSLDQAVASGWGAQSAFVVRRIGAMSGQPVSSTTKDDAAVVSPVAFPLLKLSFTTARKASRCASSSSSVIPRHRASCGGQNALNADVKYV